MGYPINVTNMSDNRQSTVKPKRKAPSTAFVKGQSGNPGGRPKLPEDVKHVRELARQYTDKAVETLAMVMATGSPNAQVSAANALIDRGWGKAEQPITGADGSSIKFEVTGLSWLQPTIQIRNGS